MDTFSKKVFSDIVPECLNRKTWTVALFWLRTHTKKRKLWRYTYICDEKVSNEKVHWNSTQRKVPAAFHVHPRAALTDAFVWRKMCEHSDSPRRFGSDRCKYQWDPAGRYSIRLQVVQQPSRGPETLQLILALRLACFCFQCELPMHTWQTTGACRQQVRCLLSIFFFFLNVSPLFLTVASVG